MKTYTIHTLCSAVGRVLADRGHGDLAYRVSLSQPSAYRGGGADWDPLLDRNPVGCTVHELPLHHGGGAQFRGESSRGLNLPVANGAGAGLDLDEIAGAIAEHVIHAAGRDPSVWSQAQERAREEAIQRAVSEGHGRHFLENALVGLAAHVESAGDVLVFSICGQSLALRRVEGGYSVMGSGDAIPGTAAGGDHVRERLVRLA